METCDGDESSSAAELRETIASSRQCLAKQLTHARQFFTSTLSNAELLKHASTAERLTSWRYIVRVTKSTTRLSDLGQTKSENFSAPFDDYEAAKHFLKGLIVTQMETDEGYICKHSAKSRPDRDVPFLERLKGKQRMAKTKKTECRIEKIKPPRHRYEVYEKKHHKGMFLYWYIDVEVGGRGPDDAEMPDVHGILANRGDAVPKSKTAGMYVVTGQIYTVSSTSPDTLGPNTAGLTEAGPSRQRRTALSPAMSISRLPESVWTTCKLANEAAYSLITAHTKVNEFMRTEEDERTWRSLIRPVIDQEWEKKGYKVVSSGSPVFECTLEIPDILRDRLGYDTISVEVICIKRARQAEKKSNKRKADAAEMDGEQHNGQADS